MGYQAEGCGVPRQELPETKRVPGTCKTCGGTFEPYKVGPTLARNICWPCLHQKKYGHLPAQKESQPKPKTPTFKYKIVEPQESLPVHKNKDEITLDFSDYPWALVWLKEQTGEDMERKVVLEIAEKTPAEWLKKHMMSI